MKAWGRRVSGNRDSERREPLFLLDESLVPAVASALARVDYDIVSISDAFERTGVKDPEIIAWCRQNDAVWIHADNKARRKHMELLRTSGIRTLRIHRRPSGMTAREQLRILSYVLPRLMRNYDKKPGTLYYRASSVDDRSRISLTAE